MDYLPTCPSCYIYPRQVSTDPKSLCFRCEEKARRIKQELAAEARNPAPTAKPSKEATPYCSRCMTTQDIRHVDAATNTGICLRCLKKRHHVGPSWGMSGLNTQTADANAIY